MYLLQRFHRTRLHAVEQSTLQQRIGFLLALTIQSVVAIHKPVKKVHSLLVTNGSCQLFHASLNDNVCAILFPVGCCKLQLGSVTNHLTLFFAQFCFQILPVVAVFLMIVLLVDGANDVMFIPLQKTFG